MSNHDYGPNQIICAQCAEPFGVSFIQMEMSDADEQRFLQGQGCGACDWGAAVEETGEYLDEHRRQMVASTYDKDVTEFLL